MKIFSLIVAIVFGILSIWYAYYSYLLYANYQVLYPFIQGIEAFDKTRSNIHKSFLITIVTIFITIIAAIISFYLYKTKTQKEDNTTLLDYDKNNE